jgi:hypothetical protein
MKICDTKLFMMYKDTEGFMPQFFIWKYDDFILNDYSKDYEITEDYITEYKFVLLNDTNMIKINIKNITTETAFFAFDNYLKENL